MFAPSFRFHGRSHVLQCRYTELAPEKLEFPQFIESLLRSYAGREQQLLQQVQRKYDLHKQPTYPHIDFSPVQDSPVSSVMCFAPPEPPQPPLSESDAESDEDDDEFDPPVHRQPESNGTFVLRCVAAHTCQDAEYLPTCL